jgi:hypothetical protein
MGITPWNLMIKSAILDLIFRKGIIRLMKWNISKGTMFQEALETTFLTRYTNIIISIMLLFCLT